MNDKPDNQDKPEQPDRGRAALPNLCVTGLGSLGAEEPEQALALIERACPECPCWPQLPRRSPREVMIPQFISSWDFIEPDPEHPDFWRWPDGIAPEALDEAPPLPLPAAAAGLYAFAEALEAGRFTEARILKGQLTGPITLGRTVLAGDRPLLESEPHRRALFRWAARAARAQAELLSRARPGKPVLLYFDDPLAGSVLAAASPTPAGRAATDLMRGLFDELNAAGIRAGLHLSRHGGRWEPILDLPLGVVSFNANHDRAALLKSGEALARYLDRGGWLGWGLIDTESSHAPDELSEDQIRALIFQFLMDLIMKLEDDLEGIRKLIPQSLITPSTGLGLIDMNKAEAFLRLGGKIAGMIRGGIEELGSLESETAHEERSE